MYKVKKASLLKLINVIMHQEIPWELTEDYGFRKLAFHESKC